MGLIACPDCGGQVSTSAASCPKCGAPVRASAAPAAPVDVRAVERKVNLVKVLGTFLVLGSLGSCIGGMTTNEVIWTVGGFGGFVLGLVLFVVGRFLD
jgi:hypothetical protein